MLCEDSVKTVLVLLLCYGMGIGCLLYTSFAESGKVFAETNHGEYALRLRLYEAEQRLDSKNCLLYTSRCV